MFFFFSSRRRHTRCALVTGVQTCALPIFTPDAFDVSQGLRLRLRGRVDRVPGAGAVRCIQPAGSEQRPICVVAISLDEVLIENTATGAVLATWSVSRQIGRAHV